MALKLCECIFDFLFLYCNGMLLMEQHGAHPRLQLQSPGHVDAVPRLVQSRGKRIVGINDRHVLREALPESQTLFEGLGKCGQSKRTRTATHRMHTTKTAT